MKKPEHILIKIALTLILTIFYFILCSQNQQKTDSLLNILRSGKTDTVKVKILAELCLLYKTADFDKALKYGKLGAELAKSINYQVGIANCYYNLRGVFYNHGDYDSAFVYVTMALRIYTELSGLSEDPKQKIYKKGMTDCYTCIGLIHDYQSNYDKALEAYNRSLNIAEEILDYGGQSTCLMNIGGVYYSLGNYDKSLEYYMRSLKIKEDLKDKKGISNCYNNIGLIFRRQGNDAKALEYYTVSLKTDKEAGDKKGMTTSYILIGNIYFDLDKKDSALQCYELALKLSYEISFKNGISDSYVCIGNIYANRNDHYKAIDFYKKALTISSEVNDRKKSSLIFGNIAVIYNKLKEYPTALEYALKSLSLAEETGALIEIMLSNKNLSETYKGLKDYKTALEYFEKYKALTDSIFNIEKNELIANTEAKYQNEKKQLEIEKQKILIEKKDTDIKRQEAETGKQRAMRNAFIGGFALMLLLAVVVFRSYRQKKRANEIITKKNNELEQANEEIRVQRDEIEIQRDLVYKQKDHIEGQKKKIEDSIQYAKRIQNAVLSPDQYSHSILGEHFIIFRPKDVVSGDFYWATKVNEWLIVTVADCTGHGVPGAFMSMLGVSFLNEIVRKKEVTDAASVLNHLRASVIEALRQTSEQGGQKDGMDMSLAAINTKTLKCTWAGANNPLYIVKSQKLESRKSQVSSPDLRPSDFQTFDLIELKGDSMPVAVHVIMNDFTNHEIQLEHGDKLYLFSDGMPDQFGGEKGRKLLYKRFKCIIAETSALTMKEQGELIEKELNNWMTGFDEKYEQIDDITIVGLKI